MPVSRRRKKPSRRESPDGLSVPPVVTEHVIRMSVPPPRLDLAVVALVVVAGLGVAVSAWLVLAHGLGGGAEGGAFAAATVSLLFGCLGVGQLRERPTGAALVIGWSGGLTVPGRTSFYRWVAPVRWLLPLALVELWRLLTGALVIESRRGSSAVLWSALVPLMLWAVHLWTFLRGRPTEPAALLRTEPRVTLDATGVTLVPPRRDAVRIPWEEVPPRPAGRTPAQWLLPRSPRGLDRGLDADPEVVARVIEHFRTHPADRRLLHDAARAGPLVEEAAAPSS